MRRNPPASPSEPAISKATLNKMSHIRKAQLEASYNSKNNQEHEPLVAIAHGNHFQRTASFGQTVLPTTSSRVDKLSPDVYSPLFQLANLNLPRDRITMNAWNRVFYDTHPIIRNCINLHASYPISKINITCKNQKVQDFFMEMADRIDLYNIVYSAALEYWKLGEVFPYAELDPDSGSWKRITILNPDYVSVEKSVIGDQTSISLRPDATLQRIINASDPKSISLKKKLPPYILEHVKRGENIPLNSLNVSHLKLLSSPYDSRGLSIIVSTWKDLMLYDKLRESKFAQADGMINPITHVTLGGGSNPDYRPTSADIQAIKETLEEAQYDKDFKMITHDGVKIERNGYSGGVLDITADIELINRNIYSGMMVPQSLVEHESATYASSSIGLEVLRQRYDIFRNMIKKWLERQIFAPICEIQDFFEYQNGEKRLIVPNVEFNHMNLWDMADYVNTIGTFVTSKQVSVQTLHRSLGTSYEEEQKRIKQELLNEIILEKEKQALASMRLAELRNIDVDTVINEPTQEDMEAPQGGEELSLPGVGGDPFGAEPPSPLGGAGGMPEAAPPSPIPEAPPIK